jgi:hypothetical protein
MVFRSGNEREDGEVNGLNCGTIERVEGGGHKPNKSQRNKVGIHDKTLSIWTGYSD